MVDDNVPEGHILCISDSKGDVITRLRNDDLVLKDCVVISDD